MEKTIRLKRELAYTGMILKIYRDTVVANGIEEVYDYIHHDGAAAVLPVTKDGKVLANGHEARWDFIHHDGAAAVLPVADDGKILMVRQYRNALDRYTLEIPAGKLDAPDEPKIECAARELEEETGFRSENLEFLMTVNTTVAFCDERIGVYIAKDLIPSKQHLDADESIDVEEWEVKDLLDLIYSGKMTDAKTIAAILAYAQKEGIR